MRHLVEGRHNSLRKKQAASSCIRRWRNAVDHGGLSQRAGATHARSGGRDDTDKKLRRGRNFSSRDRRPRGAVTGGSEGKTVSDAGQGYAGNVAAGDCACEASPVSRADGLVSRRAPRVLSSLRAAGALCATGLPCGNPAVRRQERLTASRSRRGETPVHFRPP